MSETKGSGGLVHQRMDFLLIGLTIVGAVLRVWQYLGNPALWLDELLLAGNIVDRSMWDLMTKPLLEAQAAPKGFLMTEKIIIFTLGASDHALRLFPFLCSLAALFAFWQVARRVLDGFGPAIALALFATAVPFIAFTAQVKQYSTDIAVAVLLLWLALDLQDRVISRRRSLWAGGAGAIAVWFSQPAVLVVAGLGASLVLLVRRGPDHAWNRRLLALGPALTFWTVSAVISTLVAVTSVTPATREFLNRYWAAGFPPAPPAFALEMHWLWRAMKMLFGTEGSASLGYLYPGFFVILTALGCFVLCRREIGAAVLIGAPIGATLAAAIAHQYPFSDRLVLFLIPGFLLALAAALESIRQGLSWISKPLGSVVVLALLGLALFPVLETPPVYETENMKLVLSYLRGRRQPDDSVYVFYAARAAVSFYRDKYGLGETDYSLGDCHRGDNRRYFEELDKFRGRARVWVLMTHTAPPFLERDDILRYLDATGLRREAFVAEPHTLNSGSSAAEAFLYDLSDRVRLAQTTADVFPVMGPTLDSKSACS